ncbi:MAG: NifU family protein [Proteobacteria bacterium]|nr:NifU family protein [Pseudomonadota bacterium]
MDWESTRPLRDEVEGALDRLRPGLVADGGNVELLGVDPDGTVRIVMQGACATCPAQMATIRIGLEEPLRRAVPGVKSVVVF